MLSKLQQQSRTDQTLLPHPYISRIHRSSERQTKCPSTHRHKCVLTWIHPDCDPRGLPRPAAPVPSSPLLSLLHGESCPPTWQRLSRGQGCCLCLNCLQQATHNEGVCQGVGPGSRLGIVSCWQHMSVQPETLDGRSRCTLQTSYTTQDCRLCPPTSTVRSNLPVLATAVLLSSPVWQHSHHHDVQLDRPSVRPQADDAIALRTPLPQHCHPSASPFRQSFAGCWSVPPHRRPHRQAARDRLESVGPGVAVVTT